MKQRNLLITIAAFTTIVSRVFSSVLYYFSDRGEKVLWDNWWFNTFDEYQFGALFIVISLFLWKKNRMQTILFAFGLGLVIAETNQIVWILTGNFIPYQFNSSADFIAVAISLLLVILYFSSFH